MHRLRSRGYVTMRLVDLKPAQRPAVHRLLLVGVVALALSFTLTGCGADPAAIARDQLGPSTTTTASHNDDSGSGAEPDGSPEHGTPVGASRAKRALVRAATNATASQREFHSRVSARIDRHGGGAGVSESGITTVSFRVEGVTSTNGESSMQARAGVGPIGASLDARIVADRLYLRRSRQWYDMGSAGGITLDVGRELFAHPQLYRVSGAERLHDGTLLVQGVVPGPRLAEHARNERSGPISDALQHTTRVSFTARVRGGQLVADTVNGRLGFPGAAHTPAGIDGVSLEFEERYERLPRAVEVKAPAGAVRASSLAQVLLGRSQPPP